MAFRLNLRKKLPLMTTSLLTRARWQKSLDELLSKSALPIELRIDHGERPTDVVRAIQVHGTATAKVTKENFRELQTNPPTADGLWTTSTGLNLAVQTADCLPIILYAKGGGFLQLLHAGWRGLTAGIVQEGLKTAGASLIQGTDLGAILGPCISTGPFEIGPEVCEAFGGKNLGLSPVQLGHCLQKGADDRWHGDIATAALFALVNCGVEPESIDVVRSCTYLKRNNWASFRRDGRSQLANWTRARLKDSISKPK
jgi:YfiH family protein